MLQLPRFWLFQLLITNDELLIGDLVSELKRQKTLLRSMSFEGQLTAALQDNGQGIWNSMLRNLLFHNLMLRQPRLNASELKRQKTRCAIREKTRCAVRLQSFIKLPSASNSVRIEWRSPKFVMTNWWFCFGIENLMLRNLLFHNLMLRQPRLNASQFDGSNTSLRNS